MQYNILSGGSRGDDGGKGYLESSLLNDLDAPVKLPKFVVAPTRVCEYFNAVEAHENMWAAKIKRTNEKDAYILSYHKSNKSVTSQV